MTRTERALDYALTVRLGLSRYGDGEWALWRDAVYGEGDYDDNVMPVTLDELPSEIRPAIEAAIARLVREGTE